MNNHATVQSSAPVSAAPLLQVSGALIAIIALILAAAWLVNLFLDFRISVCDICILFDLFDSADMTFFL